MLFVERSRVTLSDQLKLTLTNETERARSFFNLKNRAQERFKFNSGIWKEVRPLLGELFYDTCAYCESPLVGANSGDVEQFRPRVEACGLDGQTDSDWYWWLAYNWENLYLCCKKCQQNKKNNFPVVGKRAKIGDKGKSLKFEKNLLLDPCLDEPANHLHFLDDGTVESISATDKVALKKFAGNDRGAVTIKILALNRPDLINSRKFYAQKVIDVLDQIASRTSPEKLFNINELVGDLVAFANEFDSFVAIKRQVIARRLTADKSLIKLIEQIAPTKLSELKKLIAAELNLQNRLQPRVRGTRDLKVIATPIAITPPVDVVYENAYIRRVKIHNFRAIQNFDIIVNEWNESAEIDQEVGSSPESETFVERGVGWKMLLGENGAGKSSVLKAIALALGGEEHYRQKAVELMLEPKQVFNKKTREQSGYIQIDLSKGEPILITFDRTKLTFDSGKMGGANVYLRGYGAARLFSRHQHRADRTDTDEEPLKDTANLFHPEILLANPNKWLAVLNQPNFDSTALSLRDLLNLPDDIKKPLTKKGKEVFLDSGYGSLPLADQSDGYNSILALLTDILAGLPKTLHDKREATGIVLLDEIDSHLHPRWKMRIVGSLRKTFPYIQFITTTHEPLCLRGLKTGEITVMRREGGKISVQDNVPSTVGFRVDQLLTSELFGLESTIDPNIEEKFYNYYRLLAEPEPADKKLVQDRKTLIAKLKSELQGYNVLGFTRRDQLAYELIDEYLAKEKGFADQTERDNLKKETKRKVFELWDMVKTRHEKMQ